jgi:hypothetical protein
MELPAWNAVSSQITTYAPVSVTIICMSPRVKSLVLAAALLVMPLQGIAATLTYLLCHGETKAHGMHSPGSADRGAHQGAPQDEGDTSSYVAHNPCCNHSVSAPPIAKLPAALPDFPVQALAPDLLHDLFLPDRPQRPPLA